MTRSDGEYIKKSELLQHVVTEELSDFKDCDVIHAEEIDELTTYSFPDSAENKGEFDGMTNGETMNHILRKTFPRIIFIRGINEYNKTKSIVYSEEWENAPYQKGGE